MVKGERAGRTRRVLWWAIPWLLAVPLAFAGAQGVRGVWEVGQHWSYAGDGRPIFRMGHAVSLGEDPSDAAVLHKMAELLGEPEAKAGSAEAPAVAVPHPHPKNDPFAAMYPATLGWLVSWFSDGTWPYFMYWWRYLLLAIYVTGMVAAGAGGAWGRWAPTASAGALWLGVHPVDRVGELLGLGQANLAVAGFFGLALGALAADQRWLAAAVGALGASVKLVPAAVILPLVASRSWRALGVGAAVIVGALLAVWPALGPVGVAQDVFLILERQALNFPPWLSPASPLPLRLLGALRLAPLGLLTAVVGGLACWRAPRAPVLATTLALAVAWLGVGASALHFISEVLLLPAAVFGLGWPLVPQAPRWSWALAPLCAGPMIYRVLGGVPEITLMFGGLVTWLVLAVRLAHGVRPVRAEWFAIGASVAGAVAWTAWLATRAPPL